MSLPQGAPPPPAPGQEPISRGRLGREPEAGVLSARLGKDAGCGPRGCAWGGVGQYSKTRRAGLTPAVPSVTAGTPLGPQYLICNTRQGAAPVSQGALWVGWGRRCSCRRRAGRPQVRGTARRSIRPAAFNPGSAEAELDGTLQWEPRRRWHRGKSGAEPVGGQPRWEAGSRGLASWAGPEVQPRGRGTTGTGAWALGVQPSFRA